MSGPVPASPAIGAPQDTPPTPSGEPTTPPTAPPPAPASAGNDAHSTDDATGTPVEQRSPSPAPEVAALRAELAEANGKAEAAQQAIVDKIAKALGIASGEAPTVEEVTEQLTTAQRDARERAVDLAVYRAAPTAGADPDALLDSATFRRRVADLDPTADGFADQVAAAIAEAIKTNPRLAAAPATVPPAPRSGGQITGGSPTGADDLGSLSVEDYIKRTRKKGNS